MSRETAEKQFHEVVELYNEAKEKVFEKENLLKLSLVTQWISQMKSKNKFNIHTMEMIQVLHRLQAKKDIRFDA